VNVLLGACVQQSYPSEIRGCALKGSLCEFTPPFAFPWETFRIRVPCWVQTNDNQPVLPFKGHYLARLNEGIQFCVVNLADFMWIKYLNILHHQ